MTKLMGQNAIIADEQIIELYWQREERAIQETDKKHGQFLFRIAYNILHDRLDCEECQCVQSKCIYCEKFLFYASTKYCKRCKQSVFLHGYN